MFKPKVSKLHHNLSPASSHVSCLCNNGGFETLPRFHFLTLMASLHYILSSLIATHYILYFLGFSFVLQTVFTVWVVGI